MKQLLSVTLIFAGLVVAAGAEAPHLSNIEVAVQGLTGIVMMYVGVKLY